LMPLPEACPQPVVAAFTPALELEENEVIVVEAKIGEVLFVMTVRVESDCERDDDSAELVVLALLGPCILQSCWR
jgi:hypothetical protein